MSAELKELQKIVSKLDKKEKARLRKTLLLLKEDPIPVKILDFHQKSRF